VAWRPVPGGRYRIAQRVLSVLVLGCVALGASAYLRKDTLPPTDRLDPALGQQPVQVEDRGARFSFGYREQHYTVEPVADYELWGLVVSHNDISSIFDAYHDADSVDSKDLCVIWGRNLEAGDFRNVKYWSGSWTCNASWREGVTFHANQLSNNHLITQNASLRKLINSVHVGDQVHFRGMLVNYRDDANPDSWRNTSTTREDSGNHACEVVYVRDFEILRRGNEGWQLAWYGALWAFGVLLLAKLALMVGMGDGFKKR